MIICRKLQNQNFKKICIGQTTAAPNGAYSSKMTIIWILKRKADGVRKQIDSSTCISIKRESFNGGILEDEQRESTGGYLHHKGKSYS